VTLENKVALVTGAARRLGAASASSLHAAGANVVVHYHQSREHADALVKDLNAKRQNSAMALGTQLGSKAQAEACIDEATAQWQRLDILVNNASSFYETPIGEITDEICADLFGSNVTAPLFLTQAARSALTSQQGVVVNMVDIHGLRPYDNHSVYCAAKAALIMLTRSMAKELAPSIRVNGIAPGAILWPDNESLDDKKQDAIIKEIPLSRCGTPEDIARMVVFLCSPSANYVTGEIIKVDGGRSV